MAVDANGVFSQFHRGEARQVHQRRLCCRVGNPAQSGPRPVDARDIDDAAGPVRGYDGDGMLHGGKRARDMDADLDVEALQVDLGDTPTLRATAGIVDKAVEPAKARHGVRNHRRDVGFDADIGADETRGAAERASKSLALFLTPPGDADTCSFGYESFGGPRAASAPAPPHY